MENYNIIVEEAIHIPLISARLTELAKEGQEGLVLLNHQEGPCIIRGLGQPLHGDYDPSLGYTTLNGIPEIRRADGGLTWIHPEKGSYCLNMYGNFPNKDSKNNTNSWNTYLVKNFPPRFSYLFQRDKPDIYQIDDKQVIGTSMSEHVRRACFYEGGKRKIKQELQAIMENDPMLKHENDLKHMLSSYLPFRHGSCKDLVSNIDFPSKISSSLFIEDLRNRGRIDFLQKDRNPKRKVRGYCIGGIYPGLK
jgi:hypothetical protein